MPTDLEKTKALFNELGVEHDEKPCTKFHSITEGTVLDFTAKSHTKVDGYSGFQMSMYFTPDGAFVKMDIYE